MANILPTPGELFYIPQYCLSIVDGTDKIVLQGMVTDVKLPPLELNFDTDARSGMIGAIPLPQYFSSLEMSFTMQSFTYNAIAELANMLNGGCELSLNGCGKLHDGSGTVNVAINCKGFVGKGFGFNFPAQSSANSEFNIMLNYYKQFYSDGISNTTIIYDPHNFILSVDGTNIYQAEGEALGILTPPAP